jgi:hypothetical protein
VAPTCELILLHKHAPYRNLNDPGERDFLFPLGLSSDWDAWASDEVPGIFLQTDNRGDQAARYILCGRVDDMLEGKDLHMYGAAESREEQILGWSDNLDRSFGALVLHELADSLARQAGGLRDAVAHVKVTEIRNAVVTTQGLGEQLLDIQRNGVPFAHEVIALAEDERLFMHDVIEFRGASDHMKKQELFKNLRHGLVRQAKAILQREQQTRATAELTGQLVAAAASDRLSQINIRLQRGVFWMTLVLLLLTIVLVWDVLGDPTARSAPAELLRKWLFELD